MGIPDEMGMSVFAHRVEEFFEKSAGRTNETEIGNSWYFDSHLLAVSFDLLARHRHKKLYAKLPEPSADLEHPSVRYPYRKPLNRILVYHDAKVLHKLDFTKARTDRKVLEVGVITAVYLSR